MKKKYINIGGAGNGSGSGNKQKVRESLEAMVDLAERGGYSMLFLEVNGAARTLRRMRRMGQNLLNDMKYLDYTPFRVHIMDWCNRFIGFFSSMPNRCEKEQTAMLLQLHLKLIVYYLDKWHDDLDEGFE